MNLIRFALYIEIGNFYMTSLRIAIVSETAVSSQAAIRREVYKYKLTLVVDFAISWYRVAPMIVAVLQSGITKNFNASLLRGAFKTLLNKPSVLL